MTSLLGESSSELPSVSSNEQTDGCLQSRFIAVPASTNVQARRRHRSSPSDARLGTRSEDRVVEGTLGADRGEQCVSESVLTSRPGLTAFANKIGTRVVDECDGTSPPEDRVGCSASGSMATNPAVDTTRETEGNSSSEEVESQFDEIVKEISISATQCTAPQADGDQMLSKEAQEQDVRTPAVYCAEDSVPTIKDEQCVSESELTFRQGFTAFNIPGLQQTRLDVLTTNTGIVDLGIVLQDAEMTYRPNADQSMHDVKGSDKYKGTSNETVDTSVLSSVSVVHVQSEISECSTPNKCLINVSNHINEAVVTSSVSSVSVCV